MDFGAGLPSLSAVGVWCLCRLVRISGTIGVFICICLFALVTQQGENSSEVRTSWNAAEARCADLTVYPHPGHGHMNGWTRRRFDSLTAAHVGACGRTM